MNTRLKNCVHYSEKLCTYSDKVYTTKGINCVHSPVFRFFFLLWHLFKSTLINCIQKEPSIFFIILLILDVFMVDLRNIFQISMKIAPIFTGVCPYFLFSYFCAFFHFTMINCVQSQSVGSLIRCAHSL